MTTTVHWLISRYVQAAEPKILFVSNRGNSKDIWIMKSDGQAPKNLTKSRKTNEETPLDPSFVLHELGPFSFSDDNIVIEEDDELSLSDLDG